MLHGVHNLRQHKQRQQCADLTPHSTIGCAHIVSMTRHSCQQTTGTGAAAGGTGAGAGGAGAGLVRCGSTVPVLSPTTFILAMAQSWNQQRVHKMN